MSRSSDAWDTLGEVLGLFGDPGSTPEALFRRLADAALAVTGGHRAVLAQRARSGELDIRVARDDGGRDLDPRVLKVSRSVLESVVSSGESVFAPDVSAASVWADVQTVQELGLGAIYCVPLMVRGSRGTNVETSRIGSLARQVVGALYVDATQSGGGSFEPDDTLRVLENLGRLTTVALHNQRLYRAATADSETGLATRNHFVALFERESRHARRAEQPLTLLLIRPEGDPVEAGQSFAANLRVGDIGGRFGHDLLAAVLPATGEEGAGAFLEYLRHYMTSASFEVGIATGLGTGAEPRALFERAEADLKARISDPVEIDPAAGLLTGNAVEDHRRLQLLLDVLSAPRRSATPAEAEERIVEAMRVASGANRVAFTDADESSSAGVLCLRIEQEGASDRVVVFEGIPEAVDDRFLRALVRSAGPALDQLHRAADREGRLAEENRRLREAFEARRLVPGRSPAMRSLLEQVEKVARTEASVLLLGETGSGKEGIARLVHDLSRRDGGPFVVVDCASLPEGVVESELFGHQRGSFTGAVEDRVGQIVEAEGGTLFLDEIGELSLEVQAKLLRVLQEREVKPVGSDHPRPVDVRLVTATHQDLEAKVAEGSFREDLYFRICVLSLQVPPLRERRADILLLARHFLEQSLTGDERAGGLRLSEQAEEALLGHTWPGNVRELQHRIQRACALVRTDQIEAGDLDLEEAGGIVDLRDAVDRFEGDYLREILALFSGNVTRAATELGVSRQTLYTKFKRHDIEPA